MYPGLPQLERERLGLPPQHGMDPNEQMVSRFDFQVVSDLSISATNLFMFRIYIIRFYFSSLIQPDYYLFMI
jgi:hypothetical protein